MNFISEKRIVRAIAYAIALCVIIAFSANSFCTVFKGEPVEEGKENKGTAKVISGKASGLPALVGPKKMVAVGTFENKAGFRAEWDLGEGMAEMLTTALVQTNRFIVLERPEVKKILEEQDFGATDRTTKEGGAQIGKILRAQILVSGAITEFSSVVDDQGIGLKTDKIGLGFKQQKAHVAVNIRMYDTTTGEVLFSERVEGKATKNAIEADYANKDFAIGGQKFWATPLGEATQQCIDNAIFFIASKMQNVQWQGSIIKADDAKVYINAGSQAGVKVGDSFVVYSKGEELIDPETGLNLGSEEEKAGRITVVEVKEKYAVCTIDEGEGFKREDIIRLK